VLDIALYGIFTDEERKRRRTGKDEG
jgi:hypothetical protein